MATNCDQQQTEQTANSEAEIISTVPVCLKHVTKIVVPFLQKGSVGYFEFVRSERYFANLSPPKKQIMKQIMNSLGSKREQPTKSSHIFLIITNHKLVRIMMSKVSRKINI